MNLFDDEILHPNCTVQELRNTETGEVSFGWWENENPPRKSSYDKIRAMTIEEMAIMFTMMDRIFIVPKNESLHQAWLRWLREERE